MKNTIHYYYGIITDEIHQTQKRYSFKAGKEQYVLLPTDRSIEELQELYQISNRMLQSQIYCHEMILNVSKQLITYINATPYILLKTRVYNDDNIILSDIILFQSKTLDMSDKKLLKRNDWYQLWTNKIDYFEYQVNQLAKKYPMIRESFSYFVGLAETSISLYQLLARKDPVNLAIAHKRIHAQDTLFELYNPLNFIIDLPTRDASEYFKSRFLDQKDLINEVIYYINYSKLSDYDYQMFFVRLMFPTHYFDLYEEVITGSEKEKELLKIVTHVDEYELFLKQVYQYLKTRVLLPEIEWLNH